MVIRGIVLLSTHLHLLNAYALAFKRVALYNINLDRWIRWFTRNKDIVMKVKSEQLQVSCEGFEDKSGLLGIDEL
jgi:hypothetical protein